QPVLPDGPLNEALALRFLGSAGVPVKAERVAHSAQEAIEHASHLGYPIVLKILSADIAHKTEVGGVVLNLRDAGQVAAAYAQMLRDVGERAPAAKLDGVLVQHMEQGGVELIVGARRDPVF